MEFLIGGAIFMAMQAFNAFPLNPAEPILWGLF